MSNAANVMSGAPVRHPATVAGETALIDANGSGRREYPSETAKTGGEHVVSIVGIDEVDLDRCYISWRSPLRAR